MENIEYSNSLYQINEILKYITPNLKARIPKRIISYFETNKSKDFNWQIDKTVPLEKQDLLPITKEILTVLYKDYMCDDIERAKLDKTLNENEIHEKFNDVCDIAFEYEMKYGIVISPIIKNNQHFEKWVGVLPFYQNVIREGVCIYE